MMDEKFFATLYISSCSVSVGSFYSFESVPFLYCVYMLRYILMSRPMVKMPGLSRLAYIAWQSFPLCLTMMNMSAWNTASVVSVSRGSSAKLVWRNTKSLHMAPPCLPFLVVQVPTLAPCVCWHSQLTARWKNTSKWTTNMFVMSWVVKLDLHQEWS